MKCLFVHQNFPGQFRHVAKALADCPEHEVVALGEERRLRVQSGLHPAIRTYGYVPNPPKQLTTHQYLRNYEAHVRRGQAVVRAANALKQRGFLPDTIVAHPGWGEALFLRDCFPDARILLHCEYYYQAEGGDVGFDPEFPVSIDGLLRARTMNSTQLVSLVAADGGVSPTNWQKSRYPREFQSKIACIHEGVDTQRLCPAHEVRLEVGGEVFSSGDEVITYVARNLEPYRGIHSFFRSLPTLLRLRPKARVLVVGGDAVSYGLRLPPGETYRQKYQTELGGRVDWSRVTFTGILPPADYLKVLQISSCHVYLTYPFVLSWSMLEAMSVGCLVVGSDTPPVREAIREGENGLLANFFDAEGLAQKVAAAIAAGRELDFLRAKARLEMQEKFDLSTRCLPQWVRLLSP
jgi:glycosyltransferase involved in cell wall biosynthesis